MPHCSPATRAGEHGACAAPPTPAGTGRGCQPERDAPPGASTTPARRTDRRRPAGGRSRTASAPTTACRPGARRVDRRDQGSSPASSAGRSRRVEVTSGLAFRRSARHCRRSRRRPEQHRRHRARHCTRKGGPTRLSPGDNPPWQGGGPDRRGHQRAPWCLHAPVRTVDRVLQALHHPDAVLALGAWAYVVLALAVLADSVIPLIPSELLCVAAGAFAAAGRLNAWVVLSAVVIGWRAGGPGHVPPRSGRVATPPRVHDDGDAAPPPTVLRTVAGGTVAPVDVDHRRRPLRPRWSDGRRLRPAA